MLWSSLNLSNKQNHIIYTSKINQDCLEILFCTFRQQQGNSFNSIPIQFIWTFTKKLNLDYFQYSPGTNCIKDFDQILCSVTPTVDKVVTLVDPRKQLY